MVQVNTQYCGSNAYVRAWIDMTGSMTYDEAEYRYETWVSNQSQALITFYGISTTGNGKAVIRFQTINANYYYLSKTTVSDNEKRRMVDLKINDVRNVVISLNKGLIDTTANVYLYEVYRVQYDSNGGIGGTTPNEGWKWFGMDYVLESNNFYKYIDNDYRDANGWNTSRAGNGNNYSDGDVYTINASQIFYANFVNGEEKYLIEWVITNGTTTYAISSGSEGWFNVSDEPLRSTGIRVAKGSTIVLPQVTKAENGKLIYEEIGGYVSGWHVVSENWTPSDNDNPEYHQFLYSLGMKAESNMKFVAYISYDLDDYVECVFTDNQGKVVHNSGRVANGAQAYMALSGMSAKTMKNYSEGYNDWIEQYEQEFLYASVENDEHSVDFDLGAKNGYVVPDETPTEKTEQDISLAKYFDTVVIAGFGFVVMALVIAGYTVIRKKRSHMIMR